MSVIKFRAHEVIVILVLLVHVICPMLVLSLNPEEPFF
jgi:hypothetical protein